MDELEEAENPCVPSSILGGATQTKYPGTAGVFCLRNKRPNLFPRAVKTASGPASAARRDGRRHKAKSLDKQTLTRLFYLIKPINFLVKNLLQTYYKMGIWGCF